MRINGGDTKTPYGFFWSKILLVCYKATIIVLLTIKFVKGRKIMFRLSEKGKNIQKMFGAIAPHYDFLNRLLSLGIDQHWRSKAAKLVRYKHGSRILDVATGSGDLALRIAKTTPSSVRITGVDFCKEMISLGEKKVKTSPYVGRIDFRVAPCEDLPFSDNIFDSVTIAFGIRNVVDRCEGLTEMRRVLKPGGRIIILELSTPRSFLLRQIYCCYFHKLLPMIGGFFSCHKAYRYLPDSVQEFPRTEEFSSIISKLGFQNVQVQELTFGIANLFVGEKSSS